MSSPSGPSSPDEKQVLFWNIFLTDLLTRLKTTTQGLIRAEAQSRLAGGAAKAESAVEDAEWKMPKRSSL